MSLVPAVLGNDRYYAIETVDRDLWEQAANTYYLRENKPFYPRTQRTLQLSEKREKERTRSHFQEVHRSPEDEIPRARTPSLRPRWSYEEFSLHKAPSFDDTPHPSHAGM